MTDYVTVTKDGAFVAGPFTPNQAFEYVLKVQGQSVDYALKYGGYALVPSEDSPAMAVENCFVGRTADGTKVYVDIALTVQDGTGHTTVTHETAPSEYVRFSASGHTVRKYCREDNWDSGGQMLDELLDVTEPAPGFTLADLRALQSLWYAWHLNDMRAGCKHVPASDVVYRKNERYGYRELDLDATPRCPQTGYKYGSAWLVEPLPVVVLADMQNRIRQALSTIA